MEKYLKENKYLAIIPARGGSKRLPNKNILNLNEKPLIAYSIEAGLKSKYINKVVVTSDSDEILNISSKYGANTIKRPNFLSTDISTSFDAIKHTIDNFEKYEYIILLQPTSPLRDEKDIDNAIILLNEKKADAIISVCEMDHPVQCTDILPQDLSLNKFLNKEDCQKRSQDLKNYYRLNGAIYICKTSKLLEEKTFELKDNIYAYKMNRLKSVDIDTKLDFLFVQTILETL